MANNYNLAVKYSTKKMVAKAYREYCAEAAQQYAMLMDIVNNTVYSCEADSPSARDVVNNVLQQYAADGVVAERNFVLKSGVYSLSSFLSQIASTTIKQLQGIENDSEVNVNENVVLVDLNGAVQTRSISDILTEMNSNYHSVIVEKAVATAYDIGGSISEMITTIRDVISGEFNNAYTDVSNILNDSIEKVRSGYSIIDYITSRLKTSGVNDGMDEKISTFAESEDYSYTGASPITAVSCMAAANKVITYATKAFKTVCNTLYTIYNGIISVGKKIFGAVKKKLIQVVADPYDIKSINEDTGNNTVNGLFITETRSLRDYPRLRQKLETGPIHCDFIPCELMLQLHPLESETPPYATINEGFVSMVKYRGKTLDTSKPLYDSLKELYPAGESLYDFYNILSYQEEVQPSDLVHLLDLMNTFRQETINAPQVDVLCKIKPIYYKNLINDSGGSTIDEQDHPGPGPEYQYSLVKIRESLDSMAAGRDPYTSVDREEIDLYKDFVAGSFYTSAMLTLLYQEATGINRDITVRAWSLNSILGDKNYSKVTNADFFNLVTNNQIKLSNGTSISANTVPTTNVLSIFENIFQYREENPYDFKFWPYSREYTSWFDSSFEIATDERNSQAFSDFLAKAIIIAVVATISVAFLVKLKKARWNAKAEVMGKEYKLAELSSQGKDTAVALKDYKKANLKNTVLSNLSANLLVSGAEKVASGFEQTKVDLSPVIELIR